MKKKKELTPSLSLDTVIPTTTGYKTMGTIEAGDYVFGLDNKPVKVTNHIFIMKPRKVYELTFANSFKMIKVISDKFHMFPVITKTRTNIADKDFFKPTKCEDLRLTCCIEGNNREYSLIKKKPLFLHKEVGSILLDSEENIFMITDKKEEGWIGGDSYPYTAIFAYNVRDEYNI